MPVVVLSVYCCMMLANINDAAAVQKSCFGNINKENLEGQVMLQLNY